MRLFELSLELMGVAGFDGYNKMVNPAYQRALGRSLEELLSVPFLELVLPEDREYITGVLGEAHMATLAYGTLDPRLRTFQYACAGHLPPLLAGAGFLEEPQPAARALVLYTDGLVERRPVGLDNGLAVLADVVESHAGTLDALCDELLAKLEARSVADDVAVLALRLQPIGGADLALDLPAEPRQLPTLRASLRRWLAS